MLMRFDPYREFDRLTEQLASTASRAPRALPMDAYSALYLGVFPFGWNHHPTSRTSVISSLTA